MMLALAIVMPAMAYSVGSQKPKWEKICTALNPALPLPAEIRQLQEQAWQVLTNEAMRCGLAGELSPAIKDLLASREWDISENVRDACSRVLDKLPPDAQHRLLQQLFTHFKEDDRRGFFLATGLRTDFDLSALPDIHAWVLDLDVVKAHTDLRRAISEKKLDALVRQQYRIARDCRYWHCSYGESFQLEKCMWQTLTNEIVRCGHEGKLSPEIIAVMADNEMQIRETVRAACTLVLEMLPPDARQRFVQQLFKHLRKGDWRVFFLVNRLRMDADVFADVFTAPEIRKWKSKLVERNASLRRALDGKKKDAVIKQLFLLTSISHTVDGKARPEREERSLLEDHLQQAMSNEVMRCEMKGKLTSEIKALLADSDVHFETMERFSETLKTLPLESQRRLVPQFFASLKGEARKRFLQYTGMEIDASVFSTPKIQDWMVKQVKADKDCWMLYLLLDAERRDSVKETLTKTMHRLSDGLKRGKRSHFYSLIYTALPAMDGDQDSIATLADILDNLDIENHFDVRFVIPAVAMTGNTPLLEKLAHIAEWDRRRKWLGDDVIPNAYDFAHEAATALARVLDGFPEHTRWDKYDEEKRLMVSQWLKTNPVVAKPGYDPRPFSRNFRYVGFRFQ